MNPMLRLAALAVLAVLAPSALAQGLAPHVYPNPISADRAVTVEVADADAATVEVVDVLGRVVSTDASLAAGTYLVRVRYADGRSLEPVPVTVATPGRIELRLSEAASGEARWLEEPASGAAAKASRSVACAQDEVFGGFYFQENTGQLNLRPDLSPPSLRVKTTAPGNGASFTTCFGEVQGVAFRYIAGGDPGNRPLRILSPTFVGNTSVNYSANGSDGVNPYTTEYGWSETTVGSTPTVQFDLNSPFFPGLGLYELIVVDDGAVVQRAVYDGLDGLYISSNGPEGQVNLLRSILLSSIVDGFEVSGGTKPGDASFVFEFESGDGTNVNVHAGAGSPIVGVGDVIHITPKFAFPNPFDLVVNEITTTVTGMNRFGIRALRVAVGGSTDPLLGSEAQFTRVADDFLGTQYNPVADAQSPMISATASVFGAPAEYGLQFGREPAALEETGSAELAATHTGQILSPTVGGVLLDDTGEYYTARTQVRNATDAQGETIFATIENIGGGISVTVTNANGTFTDYQFIYDADVDGTNNIVATYPVGVAQTFGPDEIAVAASISSNRDANYNDASATQDYFVGFLVDLGNGNSGVAYIFPNWTSANADVEVRTFSTLVNQPFDVVGVREVD